MSTRPVSSPPPEAPGVELPQAVGASPARPVPPPHAAAALATTVAPALAGTREQFRQLGARLQARALPFRLPPPEPVGCCGRGCHGCVWEGFYTAAQVWCEEAQARLDRPG